MKEKYITDLRALDPAVVQVLMPSIQNLIQLSSGSVRESNKKIGMFAFSHLQLFPSKIRARPAPTHQQ